MSLADLIQLVPDDCECSWTGNFEGEALGWVYTITEVHRRCPHHGAKPRRRSTEQKEPK